MRVFGNDKPELMSFRLGDSEKVYSIPLAASLPAVLRLQWAQAAAEKDDVMREYRSEQFQLDLLNRYVGKKAVEGLSMQAVQDIFAAWVEESRGQGAEAGE